MQQKVENVIFHDNVSTIQDGLELSVTTFTTVNVEFECDGTFEVIFEGKGNKDASIWKPWIASNSATAEISEKASNKTYGYLVDTTALNQLRVRITSISGNLSVYGTCVG